MGKEIVKRTWIKPCRYCGQPFETERYQVCYCSDDCKILGQKESQSLRNLRHYKKKKLEADLSGCATNAYDRSCGMSYAQWQMNQTMDMCGKIDVDAFMASIARSATRG